jgi:glycosyltransferase involved in cell wall biosynthesis
MNCHNGEKYLFESLQSLVKQTYKNWELIFWDNCSNDKSKVIFKNFSDERFRYFYSSEYTTLYKARNSAIAKAKGQYISFCDTDDMWIKNKLELQVDKFKKYPKVGLIYSNYIVHNEVTGRSKVYSTKKLPEGNLANLKFDEYKIGILTVIFKKKLLNKYKINFNSNYNIIGDFDFIFRLTRLTNFSYIQKPLAIYRIHKNNFSNRNYYMHICELEHWLRQQKVIGKNAHIKFIENKIKYMEVILKIYRGDKIKAFFQLIKLNFNYQKIKLFIILLIPLFILKKIKNIN